MRKCSRPACDQPGLIKAGPRNYVCTGHATLTVTAAPATARSFVPAVPSSGEVVLRNTNESGIDLNALFPNLTTDNIERWRQQAMEEEDNR